MHSYSHISAEALFQSAQQMAQRIEELHELRRLVREAEARVRGDRSPRLRGRHRRRECQQLRPRDRTEHAYF